MKRILITGAQGFMGTHARYYFHPLEKSGDVEVRLADRETFNDSEALTTLLEGVDAVVHLAGVNRAPEEEIAEANIRIMEQLLAACDNAKAVPHITFASSLHIEGASAYGEGKRKAGEMLTEWGERTGGKVTIMVLPHVFGEFAKPLYNSAVATLCHQLAEGEASTVNPEAKVELVYVREAIDRFYTAIGEGTTGTVRVQGTPLALADVYAKLENFTQKYSHGVVPAFSTALDAHLFMTLHSYLFWKEPLKVIARNADDRGTLIELVRHNGEGQTFYSNTKPGEARGNHYHTRKFERFCVVGGKGEIRLRKLLTNEVQTFPVSGQEPATMDMPTYYAHSLVNTGESDLLGLFWISEQYNSSDPDTYPETP
jgi:UDP-2-acetamido-2,6-beta-L-arabino-hexul-4-ose reductase